MNFQIWAQDNHTFRMIWKKFRQKLRVKKSKFVWRKKPTPSTNISLLSYRKSEQDCSYRGESLNVPTAFKVYGAVITWKNLMK